MERKAARERIRMSPARTSGEEGFTLIELVLVILILGVILGFAFARVFDPPSGALRGDAQYLAENIRKLRNHAIASGLLVRLRLRFPNGAWKAEGMDAQGQWNPLSGSPVPPGELSSGVRLSKVRLGDGKELVDGEVELRFFPSGEAQEARLYLVDGLRQERTLTVLPFLNRVEVKHGRVETIER
jgi:prepilin-type N-terminal cleavage/methylation domain-containing protein